MAPERPERPALETAEAPEIVVALERSAFESAKAPPETHLDEEFVKKLVGSDGGFEAQPSLPPLAEKRPTGSLAAEAC